MYGDCPCQRPFGGLGLCLAPVAAAARRMVLRPGQAAPRPRIAMRRSQGRRTWGYALLCSLSREIRGR